MPIWSEIAGEILEQQNAGNPAAFDNIRRKYLLKHHQHTENSVILYASGWLQKNNAPPEAITINDEDIQALMEVTNGIGGGCLDLILHSPGGSPEAAEAIVSYLRSRFQTIRVIVPQLAMSAATMVACAADEIVLGKHSFLGPIDPQVLLMTSLGTRYGPAQAILDQFGRAKRECADPETLAAWLPMLSQYGPDLLELCDSSIQLSRNLVETWLKAYMFKGKAGGAKKAEDIANWLANHNNFKSHSRHIPRNEIEDHQLVISHLEDDPKLQDFALSVFHAATHTITGTNAVKIVENHTGRAYIKYFFPPS